MVDCPFRDDPGGMEAPLALLGSHCLPDAMTSATFYWGLPYAVIPPAMSATVLVAVALAASSRPPGRQEPGCWRRPCLVVLWLLPRIGPRLERPGHGRGAIPAGVAVVAAAEWETASR